MYSGDPFRWKTLPSGVAIGIRPPSSDSSAQLSDSLIGSHHSYFSYTELDGSNSSSQSPLQSDLTSAAAPSVAQSAAASSSQPKKRSREELRREAYEKCLRESATHLVHWTRPELHAVLWAFGEKHDEVTIDDARRIIQQRLQEHEMPSLDRIPLQKRPRTSHPNSTTQITTHPVPERFVNSDILLQSAGGSIGTPAANNISLWNIDSARWGTILSNTIVKSLAKDLFTNEQRASSQVEIVSKHSGSWSLSSLIRGLLRFEDAPPNSRSLLPTMLHGHETQHLKSVLQLLADAAAATPELQAYGGSSAFLLRLAVVSQDFMQDARGAQRTLEESLRTLNLAPELGLDSQKRIMMLAVRSRLYSRMGSARRVQRDYKSAMQWCGDAYKLLQCRLRGTKYLRSLRGSCTALFGVALRYAGETAESCERLYEAVALFEGLNDDFGLSWTSTELVRSLLAAQKFTEVECICENMQLLHKGDICLAFQATMLSYECAKERLYIPRDVLNSSDSQDRAGATDLLDRAQSLLCKAESLLDSMKVLCACYHSHRGWLNKSKQFVTVKLRKMAQFTCNSHPLQSDIQALGPLSEKA